MFENRLLENISSYTHVFQILLVWW